MAGDNLLPFDESHALVLVASSNPSYWHRVREALDDRFAIAYAVDLRGALEILGRHRPAVVVLGAKLLDVELEEALSCIGHQFPDTGLIVITPKGQPQPSIDLGRDCSLLDEVQLSASLLPVVQQILVRARRRRDGAGPSPKEGSVAELATYREMVVGKNPGALRQLDIARRVAPFEVCVLINGESGTGKEVLARWIHDKSPRARQPFEAVDLPSIPTELFESVLFGHERGSFTGAVAQREGKFQRAHRGTLFLDEIASLRLDLQPKLLRALQERVVESVGGSGPRSCDVRVIAATNVDLAAAVKRGRFRPDLYYRLCVVTINLVPLRRRCEDIPAFVDFFCKRHARRFGLVEAPSVGAEALAALQSYDWPGNIRELENRVQRAVLLSDGDGQLRREHFFGDLIEESEAGEGGGEISVSFGECTHSLAEIEALYIQQILRVTDGNQSQAAQILQIDRKTLRNKLQRFAELVGDRPLQSAS